MKLFNIFLCANLFFIGNVLTAETPCPGEYNRATWTNCTGTLKDTEGEYKNNKFHGKGTMIYKDGTEYSGNFRNGKAEGQGTIKFHYCRRYLGGMKNCNFHRK